MKSQLMDGRVCAGKVYEDLRLRVQRLKEVGVFPKLALILVGEDPASQMYVRMKAKRALEIGISVERIRLSKDASEEALKALIRDLNEDPGLHGILLQLPLPEGLDAPSILASILPEKDVDGITEARCADGFSFTPCTPKGILRLIRDTGISIEGKHAVVVGRSALVGKPTAELLLKENATVTLCHSKTRELSHFTSMADILVAAAGSPGLIRGDMLKPGSLVVDVGQSLVEGQWKGDTVFEEALERAAFLTPPTGGVGPMTIAMLMENTVEAAERFGK